MMQASTGLAVIGGIGLLVLVSAPPASAGPDRDHWRWGDAKQHQGHIDKRGRKRPKVLFGARRYPYFGVEPGRNFGVGPDSYTCTGYDCNW